MSTFNEFLETVEERNRQFVSEINTFLEENGCACKIKSAKSGFVVSYVRGDTKKTLMNFVMRKSGTHARIYAARSGEYGDFLDTLLPEIKARIKKANDCRKFVDPNTDSRCEGGYMFTMDGEVYKKCRNSAFFIPLSDENNLFIKKFLEKELKV